MKHLVSCVVGESTRDVLHPCHPSRCPERVRHDHLQNLLHDRPYHARDLSLDRDPFRPCPLSLVL